MESESECQLEDAADHAPAVARELGLRHEGRSRGSTSPVSSCRRGRVLIDVTNLSAEDDFHEYKRGSTPPATLKDKLGKAASAFWNSGGGALVVGADSAGALDAGMPSVIGRQPVRDWIDQALMAVHPDGPYTVTVYEGASLAPHQLTAGAVIAVIEFAESHLAPHMAPDGRYYIRAGAHSVPAANFLVEALWARRNQRHPRLVHMLQEKGAGTEVLQLVVLNISSEPALEVELTIDPRPEMWKDDTTQFPLVYPVVDRTSPIEIDVATWHMSEDRIGRESVVYLQYTDALGRLYTYEKQLWIQSFTPWKVGTTDKLVKSTDKVAEAIRHGFNTIAKKLQRPGD